MKLLFILSEYLPQSGGGIISYYAGVLPHLVLAGHEVQVLVAATDFLDQSDRVIDGVQVSYLKSENLKTYLTKFERFRHGYHAFSAFLPVAWAAWQQVSGGKGYDLVETTDFPMLYAPWVSGDAALPVNLSLHGSPGQLDWFEHPGRHSMDADVVRLTERAAFGTVYALQANSSANAGFWGHLTRREVPVLPPTYKGVGMYPVTPESCPGGLVVGRFQRWKGPRVLCEAMQSMPDLVMRWIGKDVIDPSAGGTFSASLASEFPHIVGTRLRLEGPMPHAEARKQIAGAKFLCVPSTWDVFNLTVVEAMELGTPVICSTAAGASMLIRHGENGFLFDPEQPRELVQAIESLRALDERSRHDLIQKARETLIHELDPNVLAAKRASYYQSLADHWRPGPKDAWLATLLAPRPDSSEASAVLQSFSAIRLGKAACLQFVAGLRRRIRNIKS